MPNSQVPNGLVAYFQTDDSYKRYSYGAIAYVFTLTHFMQASKWEIWSAVVRQESERIREFGFNCRPVYIVMIPASPKT